MTILHLDFETRSVLDLHTVGLDNYSRHPSTQVLMLGWAFDDDPVELWQPHVVPELPKEVSKALDSDVTLAAWNAPFERTIFHRCLGKWLENPRWLDSMVYGRHLSLPGKLEDAGPAFGLPEDEAKIKDGKRL